MDTSALAALSPRPLGEEDPDLTGWIVVQPQPIKNLCLSIIDAGQKSLSVVQQSDLYRSLKKSVRQLSPFPKQKEKKEENREESAKLLRHSIYYINQFENQLQIIAPVPDSKAIFNETTFSENIKMIEQDKHFYRIETLIMQVKFQNQLWKNLPTDCSYFSYMIVPRFEKKDQYELSYRMYNHDKKMNIYSCAILTPLSDRKGIQVETRNGLIYRFQTVGEGLITLKNFLYK